MQKFLCLLGRHDLTLFVDDRARFTQQCECCGLKLFFKKAVDRETGIEFFFWSQQMWNQSGSGPGNPRGV